MKLVGMRVEKPYEFDSALHCSLFSIRRVFLDVVTDIDAPVPLAVP